MEAGLAFPTAGEGWQGDEGRVYPTSVTEMVLWELGRWVHRCDLPFPPSHFLQRGDGPALCRDLFDPPSESRGSRCRFHVEDEETEARQSGMLKSHSKSAMEMGVLKIPVALFFKHVLIKTV